MKRFLLFTGAYYEQRGGWDDFEKSFDSIEEAIEYYGGNASDEPHNDSYDWFHLIDLETEEEIMHGEYDYKTASINVYTPT